MLLSKANTNSIQLSIMVFLPGVFLCLVDFLQQCVSCTLETEKSAEAVVDVIHSDQLIRALLILGFLISDLVKPKYCLLSVSSREMNISPHHSQLVFS